MMFRRNIESALATVRPGRWGVGVSGGADSVALLRLLASRPDLSLHVIHLDHQTRGQASAADAEFVAELAATLQFPCTIALRQTVEQGTREFEANPSARYRAARLQLFREVVKREDLAGVILAHHQDDQAETVLHRLIRGSGPAGLAGMGSEAQLGGLTILRPLLSLRRQDLRDHLERIGQTWREDASNASDDYLRNRLRRWLADEPRLHPAMIELANACRTLRDWTTENAPALAETFSLHQLARLPDVLAFRSARTWLVAGGAPPVELTEPTLERLIEMARDAAMPARMDFPGSVCVRRQEGMISIDRTRI
jgi:tRNA(Ile)-lysidine synthetase-like protein